MPTEQPYQGVVAPTLEESTPWWPPLRGAPADAPNVVIVLLDDVDYAQVGCYGSDIATPTFDRLAAGGLRFSNFHTMALCSPTRAALLTGRNHHTNGMGRIVEFASGFPGYDAHVPKDSGFLSEILLQSGYATFAVGKWHLAPAGEMSMGSPRDKWPLGRGFERFYGFLAGETDQYHPDLVYDNHQIDPPSTPEEGYHLTEDLAAKASLFINDLRAVAPDKPFMLWFAPGACHAPHQAPRAYIDAYRGRFDHGWDAWRDEVFDRQVGSGLLPGGTRLSERPHWVPAWESLSPDERRLYARMMEVYAGFMTHTDDQVGTVLDLIGSLGETDNTVVLVMNDNGASAEGGPRGSFNEMYFFNFEPESLEENLARIDELGTPGQTRHQYIHAIDVMPTLLAAIGIEAPSQIKGVVQSPIEGISFGRCITTAGRRWLSTLSPGWPTTAVTRTVPSIRTIGSYTTSPKTSPRPSIWPLGTPTSRRSCRNFGGRRRRSTTSCLSITALVEGLTGATGGTATSSVPVSAAFLRQRLPICATGDGDSWPS